VVLTYNPAPSDAFSKCYTLLSRLGEPMKRSVPAFQPNQLLLKAFHKKSDGQ